MINITSFMRGCFQYLHLVTPNLFQGLVLVVPYSKRDAETTLRQAQGRIQHDTYESILETLSLSFTIEASSKTVFPRTGCIASGAISANGTSTNALSCAKG